MPLNSDEVEKVRLVLASSGWNDVMRPRIENRGRNAMRALTLNRSERTEVFKGQEYDTEDDALRAMIRSCEWMMVVWENEVKVHDQNRRLDELNRPGEVTGNSVANPR